MKPEKGVVGPAKSHLLETEVDGDISVYDPKTEQVTVLNGTASDIWRLADGTLNIDEIVAVLASAYEVDAGEISDDVEDTITRLAEAGLIESQ